MYDNLVDHEVVRARVEKRLEPRLRLMRQRMWLLLHIAVFIIAGLVFAGLYGNPTFYSIVTKTIPASTWTMPGTSQVFTTAASTYDIITPYFLVSLVSVLWPVVLLTHMLIVWTASRRERIIEREMERELDLEKMRLQIELARIQDSIDTNELEKPKRRASLSDDGELVFDDNTGTSNTATTESFSQGRKRE